MTASSFDPRHGHDPAVRRAALERLDALIEAAPDPIPVPEEGRETPDRDPATAVRMALPRARDRADADMGAHLGDASSDAPPVAPPRTHRPRPGAAAGGRRGAGMGPGMGPGAMARGAGPAAGSPGGDRRRAVARRALAVLTETPEDGRGRVPGLEDAGVTVAGVDRLLDLLRGQAADPSRPAGRRAGVVLAELLKTATGDDAGAEAVDPGALRRLLARLRRQVEEGA